MSASKSKCITTANKVLPPWLLSKLIMKWNHVPVTEVEWRFQSPGSELILPLGCYRTKTKENRGWDDDPDMMSQRSFISVQRCTLKPSSTRSCRLRAACVQVMAMILASLTSRYLDLSSPLRKSSNARNSCRQENVTALRTPNEISCRVYNITLHFQH